jgi:hypothetical protein
MRDDDQIVPYAVFQTGALSAGSAAGHVRHYPASNPRRTRSPHANVRVPFFSPNL